MFIFMHVVSTTGYESLTILSDQGTRVKVAATRSLGLIAREIYAHFWARDPGGVNTEVHEIYSDSEGSVIQVDILRGVDHYEDLQGWAENWPE